MKKLLLPLFFCLILISGCASPSGTAPESTADTERSALKDVPAQIQSVFDLLVQAYAAEDVDLVLSCYQPIETCTDVVRNTDTIYTEAMNREELTWLFAMIDDIHIEFTTSQVITEDRTAMVRTVRRASAPGFPDAYVELSYVLLKQGNKWRIAHEVLLTERYDETGSMGTAVDPKKNALEHKTWPRF